MAMITRLVKHLLVGSLLLMMLSAANPMPGTGQSRRNPYSELETNGLRTPPGRFVSGGINFAINGVPTLDAPPSGSPDAFYYSRLVSEILFRDTGLNRDRSRLWLADPSVSGSPYYTTTLLYDAGRDSNDPQWNPAGTQVVFCSSLPVDGADVDLFSLTLATASVTQLTAAPGADCLAVYSPNGQKIAFVSQRDGNSEIYVMDANGANETRLTEFTSGDWFPTWSPDGSQIAWVRQLDANNARIMVMNADGSNQQPISSSLRYLENLHWSGDGQYFAFDYDANADNLTELATYHPGTDTLRNFAMGGSNVEYIVLDWGAKPHTLLVEGRWLTVVNNEYLIANTTLHKIDVSAAVSWNQGQISLDRSTNDSDEFLNAAALFRTDKVAPVSNLAPVAPFSRAQGFSISWSASDPGIAGLYDLEVTRKLSPADPSPQTLVYAAPANGINPAAGSAWAYGIPDETWHLYSQAGDYAENKEEASAAEWVTQLYGWKVEGQVTDVRGGAIPLQSITAPQALNSPASNVLGHYAAYYANQGEIVTLGIAGQPAATRTIDSDRRLHLVLAPKEDLLLNGTFEADPLQNWTPGGSGTPEAVAGYTGTNALRLGAGCVSTACLSGPEDLGDSSSNQLAMAVDAQGNVHLVDGRFYHRKTPGAGWSAPLEIAPNGSSGYPYVEIDTDGNVYVIANGYIVVNPPAAPPVTPTLIAAGLRPRDLWMGLDGTLKIATTTLTHVQIYQRAAGETTWVQIKNVAFDDADAAFKQDGSLIAVHDTQVQPVLLIAANGAESYASSPFLPTNNRIVLEVDPDDNLHLFQNYEYFTRDNVDTWTPVLPVSANFRADHEFSVTLDPQGGLWAANDFPDSVTTAVALGYKAPGGDTVFDLQTLSLDPAQWSFTREPVVAAGPDGSLHLAMVGRQSVQGGVDRLLYFGPHSNPSTVETSIAQTITIPAGMHEPTLSFFYRLNGWETQPLGGLRVEITPQNGSPVTLLHLTQPEREWLHVWTDLSAYAGQTVTIRFIHSQPQDAAVSEATIDDVMVGGWETPIINSVEPQPLIFPIQPGTTLIIHGANFMDDADHPPAVSIDGAAATVVWLNENTLQVNVPTNLQPGYHDLRVTNPRGDWAELADGLYVEARVFLPVINRLLP